MAKIGKYAVHLADETGELHSFLPGREVPAWAEKRLGEHCFKGGTDLDEREARVNGGTPAGDSLAGEADADDDDDDGHDAGGNAGGPPPKSGKGGGIDHWREYAQYHGIDTDGLSKDAIIAELEAAGVPVE